MLHDLSMWWQSGRQSASCDDETCPHSTGHTIFKWRQGAWLDSVTLDCYCVRNCAESQGNLPDESQMMDVMTQLSLDFNVTAVIDLVWLICSKSNLHTWWQIGGQETVTLYDEYNFTFVTSLAVQWIGDGWLVTFSTRLLLDCWILSERHGCNS